MNKGGLKQLWNKKAPWYVKVLRTGTLSLALVTASPYAFEALPGEPLPEDQLTQLQSFYQGNTDISAIRIHSSKFSDMFLAANSAVASTYGHTVLVQSELLGDPYFSYIMAHEIGHTIQQEKNKALAYLHGFTQKLGVIFSSKTIQELYDYSLREHDNFGDYGIEQQASILADYYNVTNGLSPYHLKDRLTDTERDALYSKVLAGFLQKQAPATERPSVPAV